MLFFIPPPTVLEKNFKKFCHPAFQVSLALVERMSIAKVEFILVVKGGSFLASKGKGSC